MRELRAVRVSDDGKEILLTETTGTQGRRSSVRQMPAFHAPRRRPIASHASPTPDHRGKPSGERPLPREIQARLRAGDTAEEVAEAAGIPVARVARYEAPIAAERVRIVDEVRRATAPGPHRVSPGRQLGAVVDDRLADDGLDPVLAQWLARRRPDGTWLVTVDLADHHAEWSWDSAARRVRAHDNGAQRLLSPSRSSAESLIAVAQATGVTAEPAAPPVVASPGCPGAARAARSGPRRRRVDRLGHRPDAGRCPRVPGSSCCPEKAPPAAVSHRGRRLRSPPRRSTTSRERHQRAGYPAAAARRLDPRRQRRFPGPAAPRASPDPGALGVGQRRIRRFRPADAAPAG